jgi:hypothetical protein
LELAGVKDKDDNDLFILASVIFVKEEDLRELAAQEDSIELREGKR